MRWLQQMMVGWTVSALLAPSAWATTYALDKEHTTVGFKIRHLFSNVTGSFDQYEGRFVYVPGQPEQWTVTATIQAASINTKVANRDTHLRSADFFDVEQFPTLTFTSTRVTDATPTTAKLHGTLTIHGVEQPVVFDLDIHGEGKDPWGNLRSGFTARTRINRKDFGLTWNKTVETGQLLVGEDVDILLEVEGIAQE
jgi:polyisoprenoid-binding protein YceI